MRLLTRDTRLLLCCVKYTWVKRADMHLGRNGLRISITIFELYQSMGRGICMIHKRKVHCAPAP